LFQYYDRFINIALNKRFPDSSPAPRYSPLNLRAKAAAAVEKILIIEPIAKLPTLSFPQRFWAGIHFLTI